MGHLTMEEIVNKLDEYKKGCEGNGEPIPVDPHTLAWAEYWLRWAMEHDKK